MAASINISTVHRLAKRLEEDIHSRGLKIGDKYLSANEAAEMLGISRATAQRAMKVLGDSQMLLRRRSLGTFIGPGAVDQTASKVSTIYILAKHGMQNAVQAMASWMLAGIYCKSGCTNINFCFLPNDGIAYLNQLIKSAKASGEVIGFIAISCPNEIYQFLAERNLPTLVFGSLYQDKHILPSIDFDNREAARLMTQYLIDRGHKRMMLLTISDGQPGDHDFVDSVVDVLSEAGIPANFLAMRIVSADPKSALPAIRQLLQTDDRPSGLIVRDSPVIETVDRVISDLGLRTPDDVEVVYQSIEAESKKNLKHPHIVPKTEMDEIACEMGMILRQLITGSNHKNARVVIPVELSE